jgi:hypothetical protein
VAAAIIVCILSHYEHMRSYRPSSLLWSYLCLNTLIGAIRTRTYWLIGDTLTAACFTTDLVVNLLLLLLEERNKRSQIEDSDLKQSDEELAGPLCRSLFHWLNPLMLVGYKRLLTTSDLFPIDSTLYSAKLRTRFQSIAKVIHGRSTACRHCRTYAEVSQTACRKMD